MMYDVQCTGRELGVGEGDGVGENMVGDQTDAANPTSPAVANPTRVAPSAPFRLMTPPMPPSTCNVPVSAPPFTFLMPHKSLVLGVL